MFQIVTTKRTHKGGRITERKELHVQSVLDYRDYLGVQMKLAVFENRGFVFLADTGAALPAMHYDDGTTVEVFHV